MPTIRDFATTEYGSATIASLPCNMPVHEANDILIYFASKDGTPVINTTAGWTNIQNGTTTGSAYRCEWKLAASNAETLTVATGTAENWCVVVIAIDGADTSSPISTSAVSGEDSAMPFAGPSGATTGSDANCLILHAWCTDSGLSPTAFAPLVNIYAGDSGANSCGVAYTYQITAGTITAASWYGRGNDDGKGLVVAVKDDGNETQVPPYSDSTISSGNVLRPLVGLSTMFGDSWGTSFGTTLLGTTFDHVLLYETAPSYTDEYVNADDPGTADVTCPIHIGDMIYFGSDTPFVSVGIAVTTAGVTGTIVWEYSQGSSTWATATGMSNSLTSTGNHRMAFTGERVPVLWATDTVDSKTKYWVRARISVAYTTAIIISVAKENGVLAAYIVSTAAADSGTNPYTDSAQCVGTAVLTTTVGGPVLTFGAALDMDTGIIYGTNFSVLPSDFAKDIAMPYIPYGGVQICFFDTNGNYLGYSLGAQKCASLSVDGRNVYAIDWNGSATSVFKAGTINKSAVTSMYLLTSSYFAQAAARWSMLSLVTRTAISGGTSSYPLTFNEFVNAVNKCVGMFPFIVLLDNAAKVYVPLQLGGGDPIRINVDLKTIQFPKTYDGTDYYDWNVAADVAGIKFYPKSGDVIKFTNCVFTSESSYRWEFDASSADLGTNLDFAGSSVINASVTLDGAIELINVVFSGCGEIASAGATLTNCTIKNSRATAALSVSSTANMALITDCVLSGNTNALKISVAGTYTFDNVTFSGNTYDIENSSSGLVTIQCTNGSNPTTYTNTGGGTTSIVNTVSVTVNTVTDLGVDIDDARVLIMAAASGDYPFEESITIARSSSTATVTHTAHGLVTGEKVLIEGATQPEYNGIFTITYVSDNSYSYAVSGTPDTPATGTIKSTFVLLHDVTVSGTATNASVRYTSAQPFTGWVRKASSAPYYKQSTLSGSMGSTGYETTVIMIQDQ